MIAPGPRGLALLGTQLGLLRDQIGALERVAVRHGDVARIETRNLRVFLLTGPDAVQHVLRDAPDDYPANTSAAVSSHLLGEGLAHSEGDRLRRHREIIQPAFHRPRLTAGMAAIITPTAAMLERWEGLAARETTFDLLDELRRLSMEIAVHGMFGAEFPELDALCRAWWGVTDDLRRGRFGRRLHRFRAPAADQPEVALRELDSILDRAVAERRAEAATGGVIVDRGDFLSVLLTAEDTDGGRLSDREVRDEIKNIIFGAYDTTASALVRAWLLLAEHRAAEDKLVEEAHHMLGEGEPDAQALRSMSWTAQVFQETVRLYPPAPLFGRTSTRDDEICGFQVPAWSKVLVSPFILHRHRDHWPDPETFDPERFDAARSRGRHRFAYIPFGRGPRQCIGRNFGILEGHTVLAMVAARYRLRPMECPRWLTRRAQRPESLQVQLERAGA